MHNCRHGYKHKAITKASSKSGPGFAWKRKAEVNASRAPITRTMTSSGHRHSHTNHYLINKMSADKPEATADANGSDAADLAKVCIESTQK